MESGSPNTENASVEVENETFWSCIESPDEGIQRGSRSYTRRNGITVIATNYSSYTYACVCVCVCDEDFRWNKGRKRRLSARPMEEFEAGEKTERYIWKTGHQSLSCQLSI